MSDLTAKACIIFATLCATIALLFGGTAAGNDSTLYDSASAWRCGGGVKLRNMNNDPIYGTTVKWDSAGTKYDVSFPSRTDLDVQMWEWNPPKGTTWHVSWHGGIRTPSKLVLLLERCPTWRR